MTIYKVARLRQLLTEQKTALESAINDIENAALPLRTERETKQATIEPTVQRIHEINQQLKDLEQPELGALKLQLHAVNMALSEKVMMMTEPPKDGGLPKGGKV